MLEDVLENKFLAAEKGGPNVFVSGMRLETPRLQELTHQNINIISN